MNTYRQGDVLLIERPVLPVYTEKMSRDEKNRIVLALGEATGHAHVIEKEDVSLVRNGTVRYIAAPSGATVTHEEHAPVELPPGNYEVRMQRELSPADARQNIQRQSYD